MIPTFSTDLRSSKMESFDSIPLKSVYGIKLAKLWFHRRLSGYFKSNWMILYENH